MEALEFMTIVTLTCLYDRPDVDGSYASRHEHSWQTDMSEIYPSVGLVYYRMENLWIEVGPDQSKAKNVRFKEMGEPEWENIAFWYDSPFSSLIFPSAYLPVSRE